jgi:hypothetical protein
MLVCISLYHALSADFIKLWTQLSLSPSLTVTRPICSSEIRPDFSLRLVQKTTQLDQMLQPRAWLSGLIDVRPPNSVICATIQKIEIRLKMSIAQQKHDHPPKRVRPAIKRAKDKELVQLGRDCNSKNIPHIDLFEGIVEHLSCNLSQSISKCFGLPPLKTTGFNSVLLEGSAPHLANQDRENVSGELEEMLLPSSQLGDVAADAVEHVDEEMLLSPCPPSLISPVIQGEEGILFPEQTNATPILSSHCSSNSSISVSTLGSSLKRLAPSNATINTSSHLEVDPSFDILIPSAHRIMEAATRVLLTGSTSNGRKALHNIRLGKPLPATSLSRLVPGIFNPGFSEVRLNFQPSNYRLQPLTLL